MKQKNEILEDFNFHDLFNRSPELPEGFMDTISVLMQDVMNRKEENPVPPDTVGVDYFFLEGFITPDMESDFVLIEKDFLFHCQDKLSELDKAGWYGADEFRLYPPRIAQYHKIMCLIYNGAKREDTYCLELIRYLYRIYHKKEYNQLKRFSEMNPEDVMSLARDGSLPSYENMGRILGMCRFMNIRQNDSCSVLYLLLNKKRDEWLAGDEACYEFTKFKDGLMDECLEQVDAWVDREKNKDIYRKYKPYWEGMNFISECLKHQSYPEDFMYICLEHNEGIPLQMARTLAILKTMHPNREYTYEEVQRYTSLYSAAAAFVEVVDDFDIECGYLTGDEVDDWLVEHAMFKAENIKLPEQREKPTAVQKPMINIAPVCSGKASDTDYLEEIDELRKKIQRLEQENKGLRDQNRNAKLLAAELEQLSNKYQEERTELAALREFAYRSENSYEPVTEASLESMKAAIAELHIVVIGGHINWINKLKKEFPDWLFVPPDAYKTVDGKMLENKDRVYFFTDHISHVSYNKFVAITRERKIPFGYLSSINLENMVRQIYEDTEDIRLEKKR